MSSLTVIRYSSLTPDYSVTDKYHALTFVHISPITKSSSHSHPYKSSLYLQCIARKVPELCKAYTPGKTDQDVHARLARLEQIIELALPQFSNGSNPGSPAVNGGINVNRGHRGSMSPVDDDDDGSQAEEGDVGGGSFESGKWFGNTVSGSVAPGTMLEQVSMILTIPVSWCLTH